MRVHVRTRNRMHQSAIVLVRCVPGSFSFRRHIGEDPGNEVGRLHTNLYKFGENVSPHIFPKKNCCDLNLGESLCISTFFLFPDSGLNLLSGFDFFCFDLF